MIEYNNWSHDNTGIFISLGLTMFLNTSYLWLSIYNHTLITVILKVEAILVLSMGPCLKGI